MRCGKCASDYDAKNQHSVCPGCGAVVGTEAGNTLVDQLAKVIAWYEEYDTGTQENLKLQNRDVAYYNGNQLTKEEISKLNNRGQPVVVKNRIFKKINSLLGMEISNRTDPKALPRTQSHGIEADYMTDALRYVSDEQNFNSTATKVWKDILIAGYGGSIITPKIISTESPIAKNESTEPMPGGGEYESVEVSVKEQSIKVENKYIPWDRLWYDIHSRDPMFEDALYRGSWTWMDLDEAISFYGAHKDSVANYEEVLRTTSENTSSDSGSQADKPLWAQSDGKRKRVRISECYYWEAGEDGETHEYVCHYTNAGFLIAPKRTEILDEQGNDVCPLRMASAFVDGEGMRFGLVRNMIGPQDEINKRSSKALHLLSVSKVIAEDGAFLDPDTAREEYHKPDGWVTPERDALKDGRVQFIDGQKEAQGHLQLLQEAKQEIDTIGPEVPQIGGVGSNTSGRALMMLQQIGSLELAPIQDNHRNYKKECHRHHWYGIRQWWTDEMWVRVTDDSEKTGFRFVGLNIPTTKAKRFTELLQKEVPLESAASAVMGPESESVLAKANQLLQLQLQQLGPQAQQIPPEMVEQQLTNIVLKMPQMQGMMTVNDVAALDVDIVLDETPDTATIQQEVYESLVQQFPSILQAKPDMAPTILRMMIEASQLRESLKKKLLADFDKPPDEQATQLQQAMQQIAVQKGQADVMVAQSQAQLNQARAANEGAKSSTEVPKAKASIQESQAISMVHAANAGSKA